MNPQAPTFRLTNPMVFFGAIMYVANRLSDIYLNVPLGEVFLPAFVLFFLVREGSLARLRTVPGILLIFTLFAWMSVSNLANNVGLAGQVRNGFAMFTLFAPVLMFAAVKDRTSLMSYMVGLVLGFGLYFSALTGLALSHGDIPRTLRGEQLTPVVPLAYFLLFRKKLSPLVSLCLLGSAAVSIFVTLAIDVRAPLLALIIGGGLFAITRFLPKPAWILSLTLGGALIAHFLSSFFITSSFDTVLYSGNDTVSNLERAYAIDYCRMVLEQSPWFGNSPQGYATNFADFFSYIASFANVGDNIASPHNSFLEYAVFFGYPGGFIFLLLVCRLFHAGARGSGIARTLAAAFICAGIIRIGAFYGFSGWLRTEWFALMFALYYNFNTPREEAPQGPTELKQA